MQNSRNSRESQSLGWDPCHYEKFEKFSKVSSIAFPQLGVNFSKSLGWDSCHYKKFWKISSTAYLHSTLGSVRTFEKIYQSIEATHSLSLARELVLRTTCVPYSDSYSDSLCVCVCVTWPNATWLMDMWRDSWIIVRELVLYTCYRTPPYVTWRIHKWRDPSICDFMWVCCMDSRNSAYSLMTLLVVYVWCKSQKIRNMRMIMCTCYIFWHVLLTLLVLYVWFVYENIKICIL